MAEMLLNGKRNRVHTTDIPSFTQYKFSQKHFPGSHNRTFVSLHMSSEIPRSTVRFLTTFVLTAIPEKIKKVIILTSIFHYVHTLSANRTHNVKDKGGINL